MADWEAVKANLQVDQESDRRGELIPPVNAELNQELTKIVEDSIFTTFSSRAPKEVKLGAVSNLLA